MQTSRDSLGSLPARRPRLFKRANAFLAWRHGTEGHVPSDCMASLERPWHECREFSVASCLKRSPVAGGFATELRTSSASYFVAAFFLRVRTALRLAAGLRRFLPLPPYHARNRSSSASGKDRDTTTVPFGLVDIDRIFTGICSCLLLSRVPHRWAILSAKAGGQIRTALRLTKNPSRRDWLDTLLHQVIQSGGSNRLPMKSRRFGTGISSPVSVVCLGWPLRSFGLRPM